MTTLTLTKTRMVAGVWEGKLGGVGASAPQIAVHHNGAAIDGVTVKKELPQNEWFLHVPVPAAAIADGVQTFVITEADSGAVLNSFTLLGGDVLAEDIRAELDLLRAELDMLKRAFRRHCVETA